MLFKKRCAVYMYHCIKLCHKTFKLLPSNYICNIIHYPNSAEVTCTHGTSYIRVLWKTLASEAIMRIPRLVLKDGAYEANLQPEGFSAVCLFESSQAGSRLPFSDLTECVCWMCWVPQTRDARGQKCSTSSSYKHLQRNCSFCQKGTAERMDHHVFWMCFCFATWFNT